MTQPLAKYRVQRKKTLLTGGSTTSPESDEIKLPEDMLLRVATRARGLFDEYGIEYGDWPSLALTLAFTHEPSFRIEAEDAPAKRKTKPVVWHFVRLARWWWAVEQYRSEHPKLSIEAVCNRLSKTKAWEEFGANVRRYNEAKNSPMVLTLARAREKIGDIALGSALNIDWDKLLSDADDLGMSK